MFRLSMRLTTTATLALISATPALAEITAEDVWQNLQAPLMAMGSEWEAETTRSNNSLNVGERAVRFTLPFEAGTVELVTSGFKLSENGDGTVAMMVPQVMTVSVSGEKAGEPLFDASIDFETTGYTIKATGTPGDITYVYSLASGAVKLTSLEVAAAPDFEADVALTMSGQTGSYRITEGDITEVVLNASGGNFEYNMRTLDQFGVEVVDTQKIVAGISDINIAIPTGQASLLNLSDALRAGLSLSLKGAGGRLDAVSMTSMDGEPIVSQNFGYAMDELTYVFDEGGLVADGVNSDFYIEVGMPSVGIPTPMRFTGDTFSGAMTMPVNKTDTAEDASFSMDLVGLEMSAEVWDMFDPGAQLPRDPARLEMTMSGKLNLLTDLLDVEALMAFSGGGQMPATVDEVKLESFVMEMAGAAMTGKGAFTLDNTDYESFDGFPAPDGSIDLEITGVNTLMDKLIGMGLVPEEQIMGARMGVAMFTKPGAGEDVLTSSIEVKPDGQVLVNGQRMR